MSKQPVTCDPEPMDSEDDLFVMYTSGASDSPKGIVHTQAGYLLHVAVTHKVIVCDGINEFYLYTKVP